MFLLVLLILPSHTLVINSERHLNVSFLLLFFSFSLFSSSKKSFVLGYIDLIIRLWIISRTYDLSWKIDLIYDI